MKEARATNRLATAWRVQRFIDEASTFKWLADARKCPKSALACDFDVDALHAALQEHHDH